MHEINGKFVRIDVYSRQGVNKTGYITNDRQKLNTKEMLTLQNRLGKEIEVERDSTGKTDKKMRELVKSGKWSNFYLGSDFTAETYLNDRELSKQIIEIII